MVSNKQSIEEIFPNDHFGGVAYSTLVLKCVPEKKNVDDK